MALITSISDRSYAWPTSPRNEEPQLGVVFCFDKFRRRLDLDIAFLGFLKDRARRFVSPRGYRAKLSLR
jgi:hypothetical protein